MKTFFLAIILFAGTGSAWGQTTVSSTFGATSGTIDANISFTTEKNSSSNAPAWNTDELRIYYASNGNGGSVTLNIANGVTVTNVKLTASSTSYTPTVKYNVDGGTDQTASLSGTEYTISGIGATSSLKIRNANTSNTQLRFKKIEVTYTSSSPCTPSNLAFSNSTTSKTMGDAPFTITPTSLNETTAIAYSSTNPSVATVNSATGEVTIVAAGTTKIKADQAAGTHNSTDYCAGSAEYTLTVAPLVAPTATAATVVTSSGFTANWDAVTGATSYKLDVYTKEGGEPVSKDVTKVFADYNFANASTFPSGTIQTGLLTFTTEKHGSNYEPAYYTVGAGIRLYQGTGDGNTFTLNITGGITVTQVDFKIGSGSDVSTYAYFVNGSETAAGTGSFASAENTTSISGLTATSQFVIKNTDSGSGKTPRLSEIKIYYSEDSETPTSITGSPFTVSATSQVVTALSEATDYYYRVKAVNGSVESANSNEIMAKTSVNTTPVVVVAESAIPSMNALVGSSSTNTITVSGQYLTADIDLSISGTDAAMFTLDKVKITPTSGSVTNEVVTITYTPTAAGTHSAVLKLNSAGAAEVTRALTGTTLMSAPTASAATNIAIGGFTANWSEVEGVSEYELSVSLSNNKLYENFDTQSGTGGNDNQWSGNVASSKTVDLTSWTLTNAYGADKCIKVGTGSSQGIAKTPVLNLNGNATLTFRAGAWNGGNEQTELLLAIEGGGSLSKSSVIMTKGAFTSYSVDITGGTANTKISFKGKQAKDSRFFLDDVKVFTLTSIPGSPFPVSDTSYCAVLKFVYSFLFIILQLFYI